LYESAQALYDRTVPLLVEGRLEEALPLCRDAVAAHRILVDAHDEYLLDFAIVLNNYATVLQRTGRLSDAEPPLREELGVRRRLAAGGAPEHRDELARVLSILGALIGSADRPDEGEALVLESIHLRRELAEADLTTYRIPLGNSLLDLARVRIAAERFEEAEPAAAESVEILRSVPGEGHLRFVAEAQHLHGIALSRTGSREAAVELLAEAVASYRNLPDDPRAAGCLMAYGTLLAEAGRTRDAAEALIGAIAVSQRAGPAYFLETAADHLKALYRAAPAEVAEQWTRTTGTKPPKWLTGSTRWWRRSS
jgi:tetratricopeptide (TPR) repeat protein